MKTRSQLKKELEIKLEEELQVQIQIKDKGGKEMVPIFEVDIDFDQASKCWKANKRSIGNGSYVYVCANAKCVKEPLVGFDFCRLHDEK